eukprot:CAMPEP_0172384682 /NCGR_PEP_ID=MMETSP1061-20121228/2419_1 /TAXON_ID=37318 /ORGANISM="Pseudo-nitzschia pungens, Strain cf. pungens" /LENGTH=231 /DNA_ID=CAMNT_0013113395 /DNA_START=65 /DNA_END=760 /DNA_ORIENTATION=+
MTASNSTAVCQRILFTVVSVAVLGSSFRGGSTRTAKATGMMVVVEAFSPRSTSCTSSTGNILPARQHGGQGACRQRLSHTCIPASTTSLAVVSPRVSVPSQAECETLGIREWPQQSKTGSWTETVKPGSSLVRYVLEGSGSLAILGGNEATASSSSSSSSFSSSPIAVSPGTLVEIEADADEGSDVRLAWTTSNDAEMILLTPGFEEGGVFLGVLAGILVLFGALLSGALG